MTAHAPAVPRKRVDVMGWLRARRRRRPAGDDQWMTLHLHCRPRVVARSTAGDLAMHLVGACWYDDAMAFRFVLAAPEDMEIKTLIMRMGDHEAEHPAGEALEHGVTYKKGQGVQFSWVLVGDDAEVES